MLQVPLVSCFEVKTAKMLLLDIYIYIYNISYIWHFNLLLSSSQCSNSMPLFTFWWNGKVQLFLIIETKHIGYVRVCILFQPWKCLLCFLWSANPPDILKREILQVYYRFNPHARRTMSSLSRAGSLGTSLLSQSHSETTAEAMGFFGGIKPLRDFQPDCVSSDRSTPSTFDGVNRDDLHRFSLGMDLFICKEK